MTMDWRGFLAGLLLACSCSVAAEPDWAFEEDYGDDLLYLHGLANYEMHPLWLQRWQNNLFNNNLLRINYASVSQTELFSDVGLVINEELIEGLWFRYATNYYATQYRNEQDNYHSVGLEKNVYKTFSVYIYGDPQFEKEEIDIQWGLSFTGADRNHYVRIAYVSVAPFWDDKNDRNSQSLNRPWGLDWSINWQWGSLRLFSQGRYNSGTEREFALEAEAAEPLLESDKIDDFTVQLYYYRKPTEFLELSYRYYDFNEQREFEDASFNYDYRNRIDIYKLGYLMPLGQKYRLRFGAHAVRQEARSEGYRAHNYHQTDWLPFIFAERRLGPGDLELGYQGSSHEWTYQGQEVLDDPEFEGYIDKVSLAYTFDFKQRAYLKIGVSQMASLSGFGGGNVQFFMDF